MHFFQPHGSRPSDCTVDRLSHCCLFNEALRFLQRLRFDWPSRIFVIALARFGTCRCAALAADTPHASSPHLLSGVEEELPEQSRPVRIPDLLNGLREGRLPVHTLLVGLPCWLWVATSFVRCTVKHQTVDIPSVSILAAGFPCTDVSKHNKHRKALVDQ